MAGAFVGSLHFIWSGLVALGFAQSILDFVHQIHFLDNPYVVAPFGFKRMFALVVVTFIGGYIAGFALSWIVSKIHKQSPVSA